MLLSTKTYSLAFCMLLTVLVQLHVTAMATAQQDESGTKVRAAYDAGIETQQQFETVASFVGASDKESKWQQIPWMPSLWNGIQLANKKKKPLFLWAMNGDPLGCV